MAGLGVVGGEGCVNEDVRGFAGCAYVLFGRAVVVVVALGVAAGDCRGEGVAAVRRTGLRRRWTCEKGGGVRRRSNRDGSCNDTPSNNPSFSAVPGCDLRGSTRRFPRFLRRLVSSIVASIALLVFASLSFFITVFIVQVGAGLAGYSSVGGNFVVLSAAILATGAIVGGATPLSSLAGVTAER